METIYSSVMRNYNGFRRPSFFPWNINKVEFDDGGMHIEGWALPLGQEPSTLRCNEIPASSQQFWSVSEFADMFPFWPGATNSYFKASWAHRPAELLRFDVAGPDGPINPRHQIVLRALDLTRIKIPDAQTMASIGEVSPHIFVQSGSTLAHQFDEHLRMASGRGFSGFRSILDWGCGSGRVIQHVKTHYAAPDAYVSGVDVDPVAINWCGRNIQGIDFGQCDLDPPTKFADGTFDVVYAYSVLTHLREADALTWIAEIHRVLKPGGYFLFTTLGTDSLSWLFPHGNNDLVTALEKRGIFDGAKNTDIDKVIADQDYYRNTWVLDEFVKDVWGRNFEFKALAPCLHYYQDCWVFQKR